MMRYGVLIFLWLLSFQYIQAQTLVNESCSREKSFLNFAEDTYVRDPALLYYDVIFYYINLEVNDTSTYIKGFTEIHAISDSLNIPEIVFELSYLHSVDSVFLNDIRQEDVTHADDLIRIIPGQNVSAGDLFKLRVYYHGMGGNTGFFSGISNRRDNNWNINVTYTLSEPFHANDWFVCKQVLTDKADSAWIFITTDTSLMAGSNGLLTSIVPLQDGKHRFEWKTSYPVAFYLLSLSVANFQDYSIYAYPKYVDKPLLIQNYIYDVPGFLEENRESIDMTSDLIELYSDLFSVYPFHEEKYGHCFAPMGGGMEHQTMTTLSSFNFALIAHELGHQWFGDNVTCATWQDIWINEGFASYIEYIALENLVSKEAAQSWMYYAHDRARTQPEGSIFIPEEEALDEYRIFSGALSYKKGAAMLHMLRYELDDDTAFFRILRNFQYEFSDSVATGLDFLSVVEKISGTEFSWFFDQWYFGKGFPYFNMTWWQEKDTLYIASSQIGSSPETPFFKTHYDFLLHFSDGSDSLVRVEQIINEQVFKIEVPVFVSDIVADPDNWVLDVTTLLKKPLAEGTFTIGPNPFSDMIWIEFNSSNVKREVIISDLNGKVIGRYETESGLISLPVEFLVRGVYLITVVEGGDSITTKIVKD